MTKILHIYGNDYSAATYEKLVKDNEIDPLELWKKSKQSESLYGMEEIPYTYAVAYKFEEVDEKFIEFIKNEVMDYDSSKHDNFYVVKE